MGDSIQDKLTRIWRTVVWILVFIVICVISLPGIIISLQYSNDSCVTKTPINVKLDEWLLAASFANIVIVLFFLPWACCKLRKFWFRVFFMIFSAIVAVWGTIGVYLAVYSNLDNCEHDSLWIMTIISLTCVGLFLLCETMYIIYLYCRYRQRQIFPDVEWDETERYGWLNDFNFSDDEMPNDLPVYSHDEDMV